LYFQKSGHFGNKCEQCGYHNKDETHAHYIDSFPSDKDKDKDHKAAKNPYTVMYLYSKSKLGRKILYTLLRQYNFQYETTLFHESYNNCPICTSSKMGQHIIWKEVKISKNNESKVLSEIELKKQTIQLFEVSTFLPLALIEMICDYWTGSNRLDLYSYYPLSTWPKKDVFLTQVNKILQRNFGGKKDKVKERITKS